MAEINSPSVLPALIICLWRGQIVFWRHLLSLIRDFNHAAQAPWLILRWLGYQEMIPMFCLSFMWLLSCYWLLLLSWCMILCCHLHDGGEIGKKGTTLSLSWSRGADFSCKFCDAPQQFCHTYINIMLTWNEVLLFSLTSWNIWNPVDLIQRNVFCLHFPCGKSKHFWKK